MTSNIYQTGRMVISIDNTGTIPRVVGKYPADVTAIEEKTYMLIIKNAFTELMRIIEKEMLYGCGESALGMQAEDEAPPSKKNRDVKPGLHSGVPTTKRNNLAYNGVDYMKNE